MVGNGLQRRRGSPAPAVNSARPEGADFINEKVPPGGCEDPALGRRSGHGRCYRGEGRGKRFTLKPDFSCCWSFSPPKRNRAEVSRALVSKQSSRADARLGTEVVCAPDRTGREQTPPKA